MESLQESGKLKPVVFFAAPPDHPPPDHASTDEP
jgi:hypothetical protein